MLKKVEYSKGARKRSSMPKDVSISRSKRWQHPHPHSHPAGTTPKAVAHAEHAEGHSSLASTQATSQRRRSSTTAELAEARKLSESDRYQSLLLGANAGDESDEDEGAEGGDSAGTKGLEVGYCMVPA